MSPGGASPRRRGDRFERMVKADLERQGWLVVRAPGSGSGSRGTALEDTGTDMLAVRNGHPPMLVSCKLGGKVAKHERETLARVAERFGCIAVICSRPQRGLIGWRMIHPPESVPDANAET
jgi:Holliday junction resolvase